MKRSVKFFCSILLVIFLIIGCRTAKKIYIHPLADIPAIKKIAVIGSGNQVFDDSLLIELLNTGAFEIIPPEIVQKKLKENNVDLRNGFDEKTTKKMKEVMGCDAILTGNIQLYNASTPEIDVVAKMYDAQTGIIIWIADIGYTGRSDLPSFGIGETKAIKTLVQKTAKEMVASLFKGN